MQYWGITLILTVSANGFHSTNLFCCFSRYQAPANSVTPSFCIQTTHNPQFLDSLRRRANARNVSFRISLRWPIHIINSVDKTKLPYIFLTLFLYTDQNFTKPLHLEDLLKTLIALYNMTLKTDAMTPEPRINFTHMYCWHKILTNLHFNLHKLFLFVVIFLESLSLSAFLFF